MTVREYMTSELVFANLEDGLHQTYTRMREHDIRHMLVVDERSCLVGIISERDLLRPGYVDAGPNHIGYYALDNSIPVQSAMTISPVSVGPDEDIASAVKLMVERKYGALPVVDDCKPVGILSVIDVLRAYQDELAA